MARCRLLAAAAALVCVAAATPALIPANSASIVWEGRKLPIGQSFAIDWTATSLSITISKASYVGVQIRDSSNGGARFAAFFNNTDQQAVSVSAGGDPNNGGNASPNLRALTFLTSPLQAAYTIGSGSAIAGQTATYTVMLLTEPQFIADVDANHTLVVDGFLTDGTVLPPPAPKARRLQFLGDSLTAGYGAGFDQPSIGPGANVTCGASVMINDAANSYGAVLCANFSADCRIEAVSGITLEAGHPNLPEIWNYTLGSMLGWPTAERVPYDFTSWVPDAVIINLGENDWNVCVPAGTCNTTAFLTAYEEAYINFVRFITDSYNAPHLPIFAAIGPHEKGQSTGILPVVANLTAAGYNVHFLNATVPLPPLLPAGCGGHPGPTIHKVSAEAAYPVIASVLGWK